MPDGFVDPYIDPASGILRNKLGITDPAALDKAERLAAVRAGQRGVPHGDFDAAHVQAIHKHLFATVYDWAGKLRTDIPVMGKGQSVFLPGAFILNGLADVHKQVKGADYFRARSPKSFAIGAAQVIGDLNYVHPFRDGNGRMQCQFLKQLGARAGHGINLVRLDGPQWMRASAAAQGKLHGRMAVLIFRAIERSDP